MQYGFATRAGRYLFAASVTLLALLAGLGLSAIAGPSALTAPFFPAVLAVTLQAGIGAASGCALFAILAALEASGGSLLHPALSDSGLATLGAFALSAALTIAIAARARRRATQEKNVLEERVQDDAHRAARTRDEFLKKLSHELRTPLSAIIGWTQVLRAQTPPEQMEHGLEVIERNARVQTRILEDLIESNRSPEGSRSADQSRGGEMKRSAAEPDKR